MGDFQWHELKGGIFQNDKGDNPDRPDMTGMLTYKGEQVKLSGWWRDGKRGKWLSMSAETPEGQAKFKKKPNQADNPMSQAGLTNHAPPASQPRQGGAPLDRSAGLNPDLPVVEGQAAAPDKEFDDDIPF